MSPRTVSCPHPWSYSTGHLLPLELWQGGKGLSDTVNSLKHSLPPLACWWPKLHSEKSLIVSLNMPVFVKSANASWGNVIGHLRYAGHFRSHLREGFDKRQIVICV